MRQLTQQSITVILATLLLAGCDGWQVSERRANQSVGEHTTTVHEVQSRRSSSFSAGQIQMTYQLLDHPVIGQQSRLKLKFRLPPFQNLNLSFSDNQHIELMHSHQVSYEGTDKGIIDVVIQYQPVDAGKTYLKFIASTADGKKIRAFAIAVPVADQTGAVPRRKKTTKSRINLPSSDNY